MYVCVFNFASPLTGHEVSEGEQKYSCIHSLTPAIDEGGWSTPQPGCFTLGKEIVQEAGWAPGPVWTGGENIAPTGTRFQDCLLLSESYTYVIIFYCIILHCYWVTAQSVR